MTEILDHSDTVVLVTGGAGFIGSNFIHHLLNRKKPPQVVNFDALTYAGSLDNLKDLPNSDCYHFVEGNLCDRELIDKTLRKFKINVIVHFAAESHVDRSIAGPEAFIKTNVVGTFNLLEAARIHWLEDKNRAIEKCLFHHISTDEVYGTLKEKDAAFTENTIYAPNSPYSASKAGSDHLVRAYHHTYGLPVTLTNCSNNYGPNQHREKLIPTIIYSCLEHKHIPVYGDGSNIRDWLYVEDHCRAIECVMQKGKLGETYNVGGNNEWPNLKIVHTICDKLDKLHECKTPHRELVTFVKDRPGHDWRYAIDISKIKNELGWEPKETFDSGLEKTIKFYMDQHSHN